MQVDDIGGITDKSSRSVVQFNEHPLNFGRKNIPIEDVVLPKVTSNFPFHTLLYDHSWTHLSGIHLADPMFGNPEKIDLVLDVDAFSRAILNGWWSGPPGTPSSFKMQFDWVLSGKVNMKKNLQASRYQMQTGVLPKCI